MTDSNLPDIKPLPEITPATAHELVRGLDALKTYRASELYQRYLRMMSQRDEQPVSANALGRMLRKIGCERRKKGFGKEARAAWLVTLGAQDARWSTGEWF